jgi:hypothetical protein
MVLVLTRTSEDELTVAVVNPSMKYTQAYHIHSLAKGNLLLCR